MPIYTVRIGDLPAHPLMVKLVRAKSKTAAAKYIADQWITAHLTTQDELADLIQNGVQVLGDAPEKDPRQIDIEDLTGSPNVAP